jgi:hypothetical protein
MSLFKYHQVVGGQIIGPNGIYPTLRYGTWWQSGQTNAVSDAMAVVCHGQIESLTASVAQTGFDPGQVLLDIPIIFAARLTFRAASGNSTSLVWAMPDPVIYMADGETVDPSQAAVANLIAVVIANCTTPAGEPLVSYDSGRRIVVPHQPVQLQ